MLQPKSKNVITLFTYISHYVLMTETNQTSETETAINFRLLTAPVINKAFYVVAFSKLGGTY